jgi:hypothetical protein
VSHTATPIVNDGKMMWNETVKANCNLERRSALSSIGYLPIAVHFFGPRFREALEAVSR